MSDGLPIGIGTKCFVYVGYPNTCWAEKGDGTMCGQEAFNELQICDECYEGLLGRPSSSTAAVNASSLDATDGSTALSLGVTA